MTESEYRQNLGAPTSPLNERQSQIASFLTIPKDQWEQKPIQDFLSRYAAIEDIQQDLTGAASVGGAERGEPAQLRPRYHNAELLLRATLLVLAHPPDDPTISDPQRYLAGKIGEAISGYGLTVVPSPQASKLENPSSTPPQQGNKPVT